MWLKLLKSKWNNFALVAVWILSITGTFLVTPALLKYSESTKIENTTRFIIAGIVALLFIPVKLKSKKSDTRHWYKMAIIGFICCLILLASYAILMDNWGVKYYNKTIVIGKTMYPEAVALKKEVAVKLSIPFVDDQTFVKSRQGNTQYIWPQWELKMRFYILSVLYILCVSATALFIISVIQSIYCHERKV